MLFFDKNFFCSNLSWIIFKVSGDGLIVHLLSSFFNTSLFPDSISYVIISHFSASSEIAISSLKSAVISFAPALDAGQFCVGSSTITSDICSGIFFAASVNINPNWPPPIIPKIFANSNYHNY